MPGRSGPPSGRYRILTGRSFRRGLRYIPVRAEADTLLHDAVKGSFQARKNREKRMPAVIFTRQRPAAGHGCAGRRGLLPQGA